MIKVSIPTDLIERIESLDEHEFRRLVKLAMRRMADEFAVTHPANAVDDETVLEFGELAAFDDTVLE